MSKPPLEVVGSEDDMENAVVENDAMFDGVPVSRLVKEPLKVVTLVTRLVIE